MAKTKAKNDKHVSRQEEAEAALAEIVKESRPISVSGLKKVNRVHELKMRLAPLEAEIRMLQGEIVTEMENKGVDILTRKGIPVVSRDETTRRSVNYELLETKYPDAAEECLNTTTGYRMNWKKPLFIEAVISS